MKSSGLLHFPSPAAIRPLDRLKQARRLRRWPQASARRFCRPVVAAGRSRDLSDSFVGRLRPIEGVGNTGERPGEFSFTPRSGSPRLDSYEALPRVTRLAGTKAAGAIMNRTLLLIHKQACDDPTDKRKSQSGCSGECRRRSRRRGRRLVGRFGTRRHGYCDRSDGGRYDRSWSRCGSCSVSCRMGPLPGLDETQPEILRALAGRRPGTLALGERLIQASRFDKRPGAQFACRPRMSFIPTTGSIPR
jgi:hypothetical protein